MNNCGKFRAVRDISVAPLDASDQQEIIKLMDETDPTVLFRKKKLFKSQEPVLDPLRIPLLGEPEKKSEKSTLGGLKPFHLGESPLLVERENNALFRDKQTQEGGH